MVGGKKYQHVVTVRTITKKCKADNASLRKAKQFKTLSVAYKLWMIFRYRLAQRFPEKNSIRQVIPVADPVCVPHKVRR